MHKDLQKFEIYKSKTMNKDNWKHRSKGMTCLTCMWFAEKEIASQTFSAETIKAVMAGSPVGRCRKRAPSMDGWPVMFKTDWCGDHKLDENKL
jgi:hypothetical protein